MSARLLATLSLVLGCASAWADTELVVYLKTSPAQPAVTVNYMKRELAALMLTAGYRVEWGKDSDSLNLVVVELNGTCALPAGYSGPMDPPRTAASLAFTSVTDGQVLPFAKVNCAALTRSLAGPLSGAAAAQRDYFYGRAMARVIAHEFYHILMQTTGHSRSGVSQSCFSPADLVSERFSFEGAVVAQMRRPQPAPAAVSDSDDASGR
ncbi:MAG: hypothetical protein JST11_00605 [Acidobacteria bacterium]|nr:hypothetical protein [Acidobacteriota bacterium]